MKRRVKARQSLLQRQGFIPDRLDDHPPGLNGHPNTLVGMQIRLPCYRSRQPDAKVIAPMLDIKNRFSHAASPDV
jgi:hypothetical protein